MVQKKKSLSKKSKTSHILAHYPKFFAKQLVFRTITWFIFLVGFIGLGKKYCQVDILGKLAKFFGREWGFSQGFLGTTEEEKIKLLNFALFFILIIIFLNVLALVLNFRFWKKDRYLENNNYYLHQRNIFVVNSLIHITSAFLLTFSFVSALTVILSLLFITFNTKNYSFSSRPNKPQFETFFSWKNQTIRKIFLYGIIVMILVPIVLGSFQDFYNKTNEASPEGFAKTFKDLLGTSGPVKLITDLLIGGNFSFFHWVILLYFAKNLISSRFQEFSDFWTKINTITTPVNNYLHFYYYRESWALTKNTSVNLGDYDFLQNSPRFLQKDYLKRDLNVPEFAQANQQVVKYIEFCVAKIPEPPKKNFLNYCLFNEFNSWEDCARTKEIIQARF